MPVKSLFNLELYEIDRPQKKKLLKLITNYSHTLPIDSMLVDKPFDFPELSEFTIDVKDTATRRSMRPVSTQRDALVSDDQMYAETYKKLVAVLEKSMQDKNTERAKSTCNILHELISKLISNIPTIEEGKKNKSETLLRSFGMPFYLPNSRTTIKKSNYLYHKRKRVNNPPDNTQLNLQHTPVTIYKTITNITIKHIP